MPNRDVHVKWGVTSGVVTTALTAIINDERLTIMEWFARLSSAAAAGYIGARLPDIIDPPTNPNHRSWGHGVLPNTIAYSAVIKTASNYRKKLSQEASEDKLLNSFAIGAMDGFVGGHLSHLALDARTPKSLPLVS